MTISQETKDSLYRLKFNNESSKMIQCAVSILIEDYSGFEKMFKSLDAKDMESFKSYPIYNLYVKRYLQEG